jgi:hypothetical protein
MADQDHAYKLLFSHAEMIRDLLEGFVKEEWLSQLDYESLEKVGSSYVSDDLRERSDDVVWRVRWGEDWIYLYLLLEFQSTVETYMAVRILTYVGLLYQDLVRARQLSADGQLPPVLAIVLYNGAARWRAPEDLAALLQPGPRALERYQPRIRYLLIDEGRYGEDELLSLRNLVAALFRLENSRSEQEVLLVVRSLVEWLNQPQQVGLRRAFVVWINRVILGRTSGGPVEGVEDLQAMGTLIEARMHEWEQQWLREGLREGAAHVVQRLLRRRFGELPEWATARLQEASPEQLDQWAERLLEVDSLEALFEN